MWTCYGDVSGDSLVPALVQDVRVPNMDHVKSLKVYDVVSRTEMKKSGRGKLIKEFAAGVEASPYAGTPPLEAFKMLIGGAASKKNAGLHIICQMRDVRHFTPRRVDICTWTSLEKILIGLRMFLAVPTSRCM